MTQGTIFTFNILSLIVMLSYDLDLIYNVSPDCTIYDLNVGLIYNVSPDCRDADGRLSGSGGHSTSLQ
jgi:hypothetical protein